MHSIMCKKCWRPNYFLFPRGITGGHPCRGRPKCHSTFSLIWWILHVFFGQLGGYDSLFTAQLRPRMPLLTRRIRPPRLITWPWKTGRKESSQTGSKYKLYSNPRRGIYLPCDASWVNFLKAPQLCPITEKVIYRVENTNPKYGLRFRSRGADLAHITRRSGPTSPLDARHGSISCLRSSIFSFA